MNKLKYYLIAFLLTASTSSLQAGLSGGGINDTSGTGATVKPPSSAPVATDTALVVGLSPNGNQATSSNQTSGAQKTQVVDGAGNVIGSAQNNQYRADGSSFRYFNANGTTVLKSGAGLLFTICINSLANGSSITLYDNTAGSGTIIIAPQVVTGGLGLGAYVLTPECLNLGGVIFSTGLTAVVAGGGTFTVTYK